MTGQRLTEFGLGFVLGSSVSGAGAGSVEAGRMLQRRRDADTAGAETVGAAAGQQTGRSGAQGAGFAVTERLRNEFNADGGLRLGVGEAWGRFAGQVREYITGRLPKNVITTLGRASRRLQMAGVPDQEIALTQSVMDKAVRHRIRLEQLVNLPAELADPVMVFSHEKSGNLDVLIDTKTDDGRSIIVGLQPDKTRQRLGIVTDIRTIHGKDKASHLLDWINKGRVTYWNKQKGREFMQDSAPANWEQYARTLDLDPNIASVDGNVNPRGDTLRQEAGSAARDAEYLAAVERGDMETAQRMVDEAAKVVGYNSPRVYHGTNRDFSAFDTKLVGSGGATPVDRGFFFDTSYGQAEQYGSDRVVSAYLKIEGAVVAKVSVLRQSTIV